MASSHSTPTVHCKFFLNKKKRCCRFTPKPDAEFCPEHACVMGIQEDRKRIPCPLNPNHNCYEDDLEKHLKKCNVTKNRQEIEKQPYFVKDINKGRSISINKTCQSVTTKKCVKDLTSELLAEIIDKVNKLYSEEVGEIEKLYLEHPRIKREIVGSCEHDLANAFGDQAVLRKEILQQASLVGQLMSVNMLKDGYSFVELGAGKGKLSQWILKATEDDFKCSFLLVERSSVRYKVESSMKVDQEKGDRFKRIKIDIQDLCLGKVASLQNTPCVVVVGKHLCGGATDLGIRCAINTLTPERCEANTNVNLFTCDKDDECEECLSKSKQTSPNLKIASCLSDHASSNVPEISLKPELSENPDEVSRETSESTQGRNVCNLPAEENTEPPTKMQRRNEKNLCSSKLQGIMIALCCHHRCTWDTYVGQEFMMKHGIDEEQFDLLTRLSSWATCARTRLKGKTTSKKKSKTDQGTEQVVGKGKQKSEDIMDVEEHKVEDLIGCTEDDSLHLREKLSVADREVIGCKAKRLIDMGRIEYLQSRNMDCFLREYIDDKFTPENVVLIAMTSATHSNENTNQPVIH